MGNRAIAAVNLENSEGKSSQEQRRGTEPRDSAYLRLVGTRVRSQRKKLGMSRKVLSQKSGVSERYLAELERGSGNASLLVLRSVAAALGQRVDDLAFEVGEVVADNDDAAIDTPKTNVGKIILVGLRGAGKSTLGRATAQRFHVPFIELNDEVERVAGMDVSEIFAEKGEDTYRALERSCLNAVLDTHKDVVVATGGGIVSDREAFQKLASGCKVVWVKTTPEVLFERARESVALRGVGLSSQAMLEIRNALAVREPMFAQADLTIDTTDKESVDTVEELVGSLV